MNSFRNLTTNDVITVLKQFDTEYSLHSVKRRAAAELAGFIARRLVDPGMMAFCLKHGGRPSNPQHQLPPVTVRYLDLAERENFVSAIGGPQSTLRLATRS
jgi:hypothetical protein